MRDCGKCVVCCVYPRIETATLKKKRMEQCPHLALPPQEKDQATYDSDVHFNCRIYSERPQVCSDYWCAWRAGHGDKGDRPDKVFMLFDHSSGVPGTIDAQPLRDGEQDTDTGKAVVERMSHTMNLPVVVRDFYTLDVIRVVGSGV